MKIPEITKEVFLAVNATLERKGITYLEDGLTEYVKINQFLVTS